MLKPSPSSSWLWELRSSLGTHPKVTHSPGKLWEAKRTCPGSQQAISPYCHHLLDLTLSLQPSWGRESAEKVRQHLQLWKKAGWGTSYVFLLDLNPLNTPSPAAQAAYSCQQPGLILWRTSYRLWQDFLMKVLEHTLLPVLFSSNSVALQNHQNPLILWTYILQYISSSYRSYAQNQTATNSSEQTQPKCTETDKQKNSET